MDRLLEGEPIRRVGEPGECLPGVPISAVMPDNATERPKRSPVAAFFAMSSACCFQLVADWTNTDAAPRDEFVPGAPISAVPPDSATARPKLSPDAAPDVASSACWLQLVPDRTN